MANVAELRGRIAQSLPALARLEGANARAEAEHLALHVLAIDRERFLSLRNEDPLDPAALDQFESLLERRLKHEPLQYILGSTPFCDLDLVVGPGVLIPRSETEVLVQRVLHWATRLGARLQTVHGLFPGDDERPDPSSAPNESTARGTTDFSIGTTPLGTSSKSMSPARSHSGVLVDVGTGSGAILLALLSGLPEWRGIGVDLSPAALAYARRNRSRYPQLAERSQLVQSDLLGSIGGTVQIVVSNPPYIDSADVPTLSPEVREHEPAIALDGGFDGLDPARRIAEQAAQRLVRGGLLALELAPTQPARLAAELVVTGSYRVLESFSDLAGRPRGLVVERT